MNSTPVSPKVWSGSLSAAGSVFVLWVLSQLPFIADAPELVQAAGAALILGGASWLGAYLKADPLRKSARHRADA